MGKINMLNFKELCFIDDVCKYCILDAYLGFYSTKSETVNLRKLFKNDDKVIGQTIENFVATINYTETISTIKNFLKVKNLADFSDKFWNCFEQNIQNYLRVIDPNNLYRIEETFQYSNIQRQVKIVARDVIKKGTMIKCLSGLYTQLTSEEEKMISQRGTDFSVMYSYKMECDLLLIGAISLINHECSSNSSYESVEKGFVYIKVNKTIEKNEEITCDYSSNYFETSNLLCECKTCIVKKNISKRELKPILTEDLLMSVAFMIKLIEYKSLIKEIKPINFDGKCQRKKQNNCGKGLAYNDLLYRKFIEFVKTNNIISVASQEKNIENDDIIKIVNGVYGYWHISSYNAVKKFVAEYFETIKEDIKDSTETEEDAEQLEEQAKKTFAYKIEQDKKRKREIKEFQKKNKKSKKARLDAAIDHTEPKTARKNESWINENGKMKAFIEKVPIPKIISTEYIAELKKAVPSIQDRSVKKIRSHLFNHFVPKKQVFFQTMP